MAVKLKTKTRPSVKMSGAKSVAKTIIKKIIPAKPAKRDPVKLGDERAALEREMERLRESLQELPEVSIEEADPALVEREKNLALLQQLERRREEIDLALKAAKKGKYGICERCGKVIDPERLEIFPEARYCVKCKTELEQIARRNMGR